MTTRVFQDDETRGASARALDDAVANIWMNEIGSLLRHYRHLPGVLDLHGDIKNNAFSLAPSDNEQMLQLRLRTLSDRFIADIRAHAQTYVDNLGIPALRGLASVTIEKTNPKSKAHKAEECPL